MDLRLPVYLCLQRAAVKHLHIDSGRKISFHFSFSNTKYTANIFGPCATSSVNFCPGGCTMNVGSPGAESEFANHFISFLLLWGSGLSWTNATHKNRYVVCMFHLLGAIGFAALIFEGAGAKNREAQEKKGGSEWHNFHSLQRSQRLFENDTWNVGANTLI